MVVFGYAPPGLWGGEIVEHEDAIEELGEKLMDEARSHVESNGIATEFEMVAKKPSKR